MDTSVWIRFLMGHEPFLAELKRLLNAGQAVGHDLVYGELLIGDKGGRKRLLTEYKQMSHATAVPHSEVVTFVEHRRLHGRGIGWIDVHLLASAIVDNAKLWTADPRLAAVAHELGVDHRSAG
ncbi:MAG TPA: PIN domain-containing protein [Bryobacteraceae bacterium]|nr:PIN domain-containing protein [Bryobacteraceae bacterium]